MNLNKDVHEYLCMHVSLTQNLDKDNPLRFSLATPKQMSRTMTRLVNPGQSGVISTEKRIIQDVDKIDYAMHEIFKAMGKVVPCLATRTVYHQHVDCRHTSDLNRPIVQQVKYKKINLHSDAITAAKEKRFHLGPI